MQWDLRAAGVGGRGRGQGASGASDASALKHAAPPGTQPAAQPQSGRGAAR